MARSKDSDSGETYERIVASAKALLETTNPSDISLRAVGRHAGVSTGTLTYYFSNRDVLLEAVLNGYYKKLEALVIEIVMEGAAHKDSRTFLEAAIRRFYKLHWEERRSMKLRSVTRTTVGELPEHVQTRFLSKFAGQGAAGLTALTGVTERRARFAIQTVTYLIMRYVLSSDSELAQALGPDTTRQDLEDHVVEVGLMLTHPLAD